MPNSVSRSQAGLLDNGSSWSSPSGLAHWLPTPAGENVTGRCDVSEPLWSFRVSARALVPCFECHRESPSAGPTSTWISALVPAQGTVGVRSQIPPRGAFEDYMDLYSKLMRALSWLVPGTPRVLCMVIRTARTIEPSLRPKTEASSSPFNPSRRFSPSH